MIRRAIARAIPEDVRQGEFDSSAEAHVNMMDFRVGQETESWFGDAFNLVQRFVSEGGYRLYPDQVTLPDQVNAGSRVKVASRWRNMGWGYFPNNLPQWNYKYKVAYALLDASAGRSGSSLTGSASLRRGSRANLSPIRSRRLPSISPPENIRGASPSSIRRRRTFRPSNWR
ncbi:MAG: hypothetical protein V8Q54_08385 [Alistipes senegalensis]